MTAPGHRAGSSRQRAGQKSAGTRSLSAFEVPVGGADCVLARLNPVRFESEAHRTTCGPPLGTRSQEDLVQAFLLGLSLDGLGAGYHQHSYLRCYLPSLQNLGGLP